MDRFNRADKTLCVLFICFLVILALRTLYPQYIIFELLLFCSEASLVGGIADWFAVTALFKKPLGFPFHTAILPRRRDAFINSCVRMLQTEFLSKRKIYRRICNADLLSWGGFPFHTAILPRRRDAFINSCVRMLQTEFLSKRKIYRRICNADLLSWGLNWAKNPDNKKYILNEVMQFLVKKITEIDTAKVAQKNSEKIAQLILKESMGDLSHNLMGVLLKSENSQLAVDKGINFLKGYFSGREGKARIDAFLENYQKQYESGLGGLMLSLALATNTLDPDELSLIIHERILDLLDDVSDKDGEKQYESGLGGLMLSLALATNTLDPDELSLIIHERILDLLDDVSDKDGELYANLINLYEEALMNIRDDENWVDSLNTLRDSFVEMGIVEKILQNSLRNFCEYLLANNNRENKLYQTIEQILSEEIDRCIEKLNTNNEFKSKINRFVLDVVHRSALKGNKLYQTIEQILSEEIDRCIEKLNTNNEFKSKINRFVLDVVHRSALKGEDVILELARKFLEGLTDKQLNELVYDKVETDMIWIRLNGSIVGGIIGFFAFWLLQLVNN